MSLEAEICDCNCHNDNGRFYSHFAPCCEYCEYCKQNITMGLMAIHQKHCISKAMRLGNAMIRNLQYNVLKASLDTMTPEERIAAEQRLAELEFEAEDEMRWSEQFAASTDVLEDLHDDILADYRSSKTSDEAAVILYGPEAVQPKNSDKIAPENL